MASFARYQCRDETLGQDAFQEAMITALTKLDTYRGDAPIEPWLRRIVVSSCSRLRRGKKNDPAPTVIGNPKARYRYEVLERLECGVLLLG